MRSISTCVGPACALAVAGSLFTACTGDDPALAPVVNVDGGALDGSAGGADARPAQLTEAGALCNAADVVPTPASAVLHLDACEVVLSGGTKALDWRDRVKNVSASGTATYLATGLGNKPALDFGGKGAGQGYQFGGDQTQLEVGANDFALFVVGTYTPDANSFGTGVTFFAKQVDTTPYRGLMLAGSLETSNSSIDRAGAQLSDNLQSYKDGFTPTGANVYLARRQGTVFQFSIDGVNAPPATIPSASDDFSAAGFQTYIGQSQNSDTVLKGRIGEVILLVSPTDAEVTATSAALAKKFGH